MGKKVVVIMPAYNAEKTLERTVKEIPSEVVDKIILIDDYSSDRTIEIARELDLEVIIHPENLGYGAAQKTGYRRALDWGADVVVMLHPDYQYSPKLLPALVSMVASGHYDMALGSRISGGGALKGGMPLYKYIANRFLSGLANLVLRLHLSEYHSGYRAFSRRLLEAMPFEKNSDGFIFDHEIIVQTVQAGFRIGEISCPTRYFPEASSLNFVRSLKYGFGVIYTILRYLIRSLPR